MAYVMDGLISDCSRSCLKIPDFVMPPKNLQEFGT